jgi:hypothetical protein
MVITDRILRFAVRRWPADEQADLAAEWAAELHVISHGPGSERTRAWRALRFCASLAWARPDRDPLLAGQVSKTRRVTTSVAALVFGPLAGAILANALVIGVMVIGQEAGFTFGLMVGPTLLLAVVPLGFLGHWLGRRRSSGPMGGTAAPIWVSVVLMVTGLVETFGIRLALGDETSGTTGSGEVGVALWALLFAATGYGLFALVRQRRRALAATIAAVGGVAAWIVGMTTAGLIGTVATEAPRSGAWRWWLVTLVDGNPGDLATSVISNDFSYYPYLLIPATVFGLAYLAGAARRPVSVLMPA